MAFALSRRREIRREEAAEARPSVARTATARGAWAVGSVMVAIARLVRLITWLVVLVIVVAIVLRVLGANQGNTIVHDIHSVGQTLVGPFKNVFSIHNPKTNMAANWGLAALVYLLVGSFIASVIARMAPTGVHPSRPVPAA